MASTPPRVTRDQILTLIAVCLASITMPFNFTAAAVALPAIGHQFAGSAMAVNWVSNAFMLTFGSCLMLAGAMADNYGRKRTFTYGIAVFALLSAALPLAPNLLIFDLLRAGARLSQNCLALRFSRNTSSCPSDPWCCPIRAFWLGMNGRFIIFLAEIQPVSCKPLLLFYPV